MMSAIKLAFYGYKRFINDELFTHFKVNSRSSSGNTGKYWKTRPKTSRLQELQPASGMPLINSVNDRVEELLMGLL